MLVFGDELRPLLAEKIGEIDENSACFARLVDGKPVVIVAIGNLRHGDCEIMGWAAPGGLTRQFMAELAAYVFGTLRVCRVSARVVASNASCHKLLARCGFEREGILRRAERGEDVVIYGLLPESLPKFARPHNGKFTETPEAG